MFQSRQTATQSPEPSGNVQPVNAVTKWPDVNQEQREAIIRDGGQLADLWELSPVHIDDNEHHTERSSTAYFLTTRCFVVASPVTTSTPELATSGAVGCHNCSLLSLLRCLPSQV